MKFTRSSGILLHPTSLAGTPGIGTIGKPAFDFVDWLADAGQSLWQILPLGPTGYGLLMHPFRPLQGIPCL